MPFVRKSAILPTLILVVLLYIIFSTLPPSEETPYTREYVQQAIPTGSSKNSGDDIHWSKHPELNPVESYIPLPTGVPKPIPRIQHEFETESWLSRWQRVKKQQEVKRVFQRSWKGYKKHAWLRDELSPLSGTHRDAFGGWAATLVDSLDTLLIMGMNEEFEEALAALDQIDFTTTDSMVINIFETTIRYVGGFLGAYDLTDGKYPILLKKATEVADMIYDAFDTENRMPQSRWEWTRSTQGLAILPSRNTILAEIGSLNLEFTRLSQLTNDSKYFDAIQRVTDFLETSQEQTKLPGLWPVTMDAYRLEFLDHRFTVGGMADSTYEYLPKEHVLLGSQTNQYRKMYGIAMETIKEHLLFRPMDENGSDVLFAGNVNIGTSTGKKNMEYRAEHLKCFLGGMVGIGAKVFERAEELSIARKLVDGCIWAYDLMPTGVMPEVFYVSACRGLDACSWDEEKWRGDVLEKLGRYAHSGDRAYDAQRIIKDHKLPPGIFDITDPSYILRPEAIESIFVLYRITGDKTLQDAAWRMFRNIDRLTRTDYANAAVDDVRNASTTKQDYMESFWMAETLKYFYLIFSEPDLVSLDKFVLNTEAHPFRRPDAMS
ncbi:hypothetical protein ASPZODRAFT_72592 [Penicilliopsis zonata CBS 506.65]|uniref:alpha-1,2-Mannosidase n=1 Tax=Penicilliopsis zonata CBS 506.65 TaxID=1073090 RepID=A0A1L9SAG9_9EURO|nr:hypothetical protein ASPZODRAFT_72592 [Penicilliopsis zonata CBS 506.65]OJJ44099.1 hypothetical protein ASPZODRAFT_72592 [Penicilliopsis zonata CBS 506.65]